MLALGLPECMNISIAEHSYCVTYLAMFFCDLTTEVETEKVLRHCLTHDWQEAVLGDIPSGSPSWASFWEIDINQEVKKAEFKVRREMEGLVKNEIDLKNCLEIELTEKEKLIVKLADLTAYLVEMLEWRYWGYKHQGWEMIWFNMVDRLEKIDLPFVPKLVKEIKWLYGQESKRQSPFLAKTNKQTNPEHKI